MRQKLLIRILLLAFVCLSLFSMAACDLFEKDGTEEASGATVAPETTGGTSSGSVDDGKITFVNSDQMDFYIMHPEMDKEPTDKFTDGVFNYYYYYLGYIENFPLVFSSAKQYTNTSGKFSISDTITAESQVSIENTVSNSVTETRSDSRSWTKGAELKITGGILSKILTNFGLEGTGKVECTDAWEVTNSHTTEQAHTVADAWAESKTKTITQDFDSESVPGYYRYVQYTKRCDVYALVVCEVGGYEGNDQFSWTYLTYTEESPKAMIEMIEYSADGNFDSDNIGELTLDLNVLDDIDTSEKLENKATPEEIPSTPIALPVNKHQCAADHGYDMSTSGNESNRKNDHDRYEMGHLVLYGCKQVNGAYKISEPSNFKIEYILDANPDDLPSVKGGDLRISDDACSSVIGTDIQGKRVGYGAYCINVKYKNGTSAPAIVTVDFLENVSIGSVVDMLGYSGLDVASISEIKITIVYELYYWANIFDHHYTNWRSEYVLSFE